MLTGAAANVASVDGGVMGKWSLVIEDDVGQQREFPFAREVVTIGRKEGNTIRLTDRNVSRFHAKFVREADVVQVEDLQAFNGVRINGHRIQGKVAIQAGDIVQIGDYVLQLRAAEMQQPVPASLRAPSHDDDDDDFAGETQRWQPPESAPTQDMSLPKALAHGGFGDDSGDTQRMTVEATKRSEAPTQEVPRVELLPEFSASVSTPMPPPAAPAVPFANATTRTPIADVGTATAAVHIEETGRITLPTSQDLSTPRLVAINTVFCGVSFPLRKAEMIVGRDADNDIVIQHSSVSRNHAKIAIDNGRVRVYDLGGANGTLVNDQEVEETALQAGDVIELGRVKLRFAPVGDGFTVSSSEIDNARRAETLGEAAPAMVMPTELIEQEAPRRLWPWAVALLVGVLAAGVLATKALGDDQVPMASSRTNEDKPVVAVATAVAVAPPTPVATPAVVAPPAPAAVVPKDIEVDPIRPPPIREANAKETPKDRDGGKMNKAAAVAAAAKKPKYDEVELAVIRRDAAAYRLKNQNAASARELQKIVRAKQATSQDVYLYAVGLIESEQIEGCRQLQVALSMTGMLDSHQDNAQERLKSSFCKK
jgi:pSer/pThr/pTyr-binding forkhead associated (FHA) protein